MYPRERKIRSKISSPRFLILRYWASTTSCKAYFSLNFVEAEQRDCSAVANVEGLPKCPFLYLHHLAEQSQGEEEIYFCEVRLSYVPCVVHMSPCNAYVLCSADTWQKIKSNYSLLTIEHNIYLPLNVLGFVTRNIDFALEQAMKDQKGSRGIALLFLWLRR